MAPRAGRQIWIGTSGWSYAHWRGIFYPDGLPQREWLAFYMQHFDTVEVNSTFYHLPRESTMASWRDRAPDGFAFALKASRFITHVKGLRGAREPLEEFLRLARLLKDRLGPVLFQLPPRFTRDIGTLEAFLKLLPDDVLGVFEFRDESWYCDETYELLASHNACFCTHDMPGAQTPRHAVGPAAYVRFHGPAERYSGSYSDRLLKDWASWMKGPWEGGRSLYACFNNDAEGCALGDAKALLKLLAPLRPGKRRG
jgi:uncharacterized protein YecE (DUF72 family)